jgi:hypothetical protein
MVERSTLLLLFREIPGLYLGPDIGYPNWSFRGVPRANAGVVDFKSYATAASFQILSNTSLGYHPNIG